MRGDNHSFAGFCSFAREVGDDMAAFMSNLHEIFKNVNLSLGCRKPKEGKKGSRAW